MLKDALTNNYLTGSDQNQNTDTLEKVLHILGNYQMTKTLVPYKASPNYTGRRVFCGWHTLLSNSGVMFEICFSRTCTSADSHEPEQAYTAGAGKIWTSWIQSKNYINGLGI